LHLVVKHKESGHVGRRCCKKLEPAMNNIIYIVGLVVVVVAILSFFGLR
jgi:hypothetical protein